MSEQIIYREELQKAVATRLQDFDVYWESEEEPPGASLGKLTARSKRDPMEKFSMTYQIQRSYYVHKSVATEEIEVFADDFICFITPEML